MCYTLHPALTAFLLALVITPASAQTTEQQADSAAKMLNGGRSETDQGSYSAFFLNNIDGKWAGVLNTDPKFYPLQYADGCNRNAFVFARSSDRGFTSHKSSKYGATDVNYTLLNGAWFTAVIPNKPEYLRSLSVIKGDNYTESDRLRYLDPIEKTLSMFIRYSDDVIVKLNYGGSPNIFVRCES